MIGFRIEDLCDLKLGLTIDFYWRWWRLGAVGDGVGNGGFDLGYVEDRVDGPHGIRESEGVRVSAWLHDDLEWAKVLF